MQGRSWPARLACLLALPALASCAVHAPYPLGIKGKHEVGVAVAHASVNERNLRLEAGGGTAAGEQASRIRALARIRADVDAAMRKRLEARSGVRLVALTPARASDAMLRRARMRGADLLLAVNVAGYGAIPRKWVWLMAGSGVVEGTAQGVAAAGVSGHPAVGLAVAAEELLQESLTWLGGAWFWNRYLAPVALEGRMWRVRDGRLVWHEIQFADSSQWTNILLHRKRPPRAARLKSSLATAEKRLLDDLDRYLEFQVLHPGKSRI